MYTKYDAAVSHIIGTCVRRGARLEEVREQDMNIYAYDVTSEVTRRLFIATDETTKRQVRCWTVLAAKVHAAVPEQNDERFAEMLGLLSDCVETLVNEKRLDLTSGIMSVIGLMNEASTTSWYDTVVDVQERVRAVGVWC